MLIFQKIRFKNLLSYGDNFTEVDFLGSNSTLIVGANGSGKSALLDALTISIFNKPFRKITKPLLISQVNERDCLIEVLFETNGKQYKIRRGLKPAKFEIYERPSTGSIRFDDWDLDTLLDQTVTGEQQKFLENNILKMNYISFLQVVVLGKAKYIPFFALDNAKRRIMVEDMLSSTIFGEMNKLLKSRILINTNMLTDFEWRIDKIQTKIELKKKHISEIERGNNIQVDDIENEITLLKNNLFESNELRHTLESTHSKYSDELHDMSACDINLRKIQAIKSKIESKINYMDNDMSFFGKHDTCPKCQQDLSVETKEESIAILERSKSNQFDKIEILDTKISKLMDVVDDYKRLTSKQNETWVKLSGINTTIDNLKLQIDERVGKIDKLKIQLDIKGAVSELLEDNNIYNKMVGEKSLLLSKAKVSSDLLKILGDEGAKSLLIKKYIPIFNKYINYYLTKMGLNISFTLDENFNEKILARYRDKSCYYSFSEGEKLRIDLAMLLTWRTVSQLRNSVNTNLLILDEIFDSSLDIEGVEGFIEALGDFSDMNVIVVSHTPDKINKWANRTLEATKNGNFSNLVAIHNEV